MDDYYLIAEVLDHYNDDGSVIIKSISDFPERLSSLNKVFISFFGKVRKLEIDFTDRLDNLTIVKFKRLDSVEDVHFLIGKMLYVEEEDLCTLPVDTYYIHDLVNSDVFLDSVFFGKLIDVLRLPNNDIYVVQKANGQEIMIPAVGKFVNKIDKENKKIILELESNIFNENENEN